MTVSPNDSDTEPAADHVIYPPRRALVLRALERAAQELDDVTVTNSFSDVFLSLDPTAVHALSPQALMAALPHRRRLFESIGSDGLVLRELSETPLDDQHTLVRNSWELRIRDRALANLVTLLSTFLLRKEGGGWRIVLYLNYQDRGELIVRRCPAFRASCAQRPTCAGVASVRNVFRYAVGVIEASRARCSRRFAAVPRPQRHATSSIGSSVASSSRRASSRR